MKKLLLLFPASFLLFSCSNSHGLFQEHIEDWDSYGDAKWRFLDNELIGEVADGAGFVMTQVSYEDFVLELEFKPDSSINSGIFIRCKEKKISAQDCYELNIWDLHPNQDYRTGAIVSRLVPVAMVHTLDKWNTYKAKAEKNRIQVWVNGTLTADLTDDDLSRGYLALQASGSGEIRFRNVSILTP
ncbi:MAG: DUF1080 domain-containing protein [Reichenbachiella sp.]